MTKTRKVKYYAVLHKDEKSDYGVSFPDFPGCVGAGETLQAAIEDGHAALQMHIDGMVEDGDPIPEPSNPTTFAKDNTVVSELSYNVDVPAQKVQRYNIAARPTDMRKIDRFLSAHGRTRDRSEFLIAAAMKEIERSERTKKPA